MTLQDRLQAHFDLTDAHGETGTALSDFATSRSMLARAEEKQPALNLAVDSEHMQPPLQHLDSPLYVWSEFKLTTRGCRKICAPCDGEHILRSP